MTTRILQGDCRELLRTLPDASVHCCVTSPPYYGLRDYGTAEWKGGDAVCSHVAGNTRGDTGTGTHNGSSAGFHGGSSVGSTRQYRDICGKCGAKRIDRQIGLEKSPAEYVATMVEVFRDVWRVLRDDGTLWLNIGDSYTSGGRSTYRSGASDNKGHRVQDDLPRPEMPDDLKPKDLMMMPARLALALQADGWWLRSDIIWAKPNPMPESVRDRPTTAHEHVFLLTKGPKYFYDATAIEERQEMLPQQRLTPRADNPDAKFHQQPTHRRPEGDTGGGKRNKRSVWWIATQPFAEAHFACVDAETQCLTAAGWKGHADLVPGMLAAQFDVATQKLSWSPIEDVARYEVSDQEMVVGSCRDLEMWLTPNHRTIIQRRHPRSRHLQPPTIIRADRLLASHSVPTAADWAFSGDASLPLEWAELLGWYVAEGHESKDSLSVEVYQSEAANGAKCRRIEQLLRQVGAEWTSATCKRTWRDRPADLTAYRISGYAAVRLRELAPGKKAPFSAVLWANDRIEAFLAGLIGGDGHRRADGRRSFVQKDIEQCGVVQALALRLGLSAMVSVRKDGVGTVWITEHRTRSFRGTNGAGSPPDRRRYTGTVWCPKLRAGTWVARRNGKVFITGNTFPPALIKPCILAGTSERGCCRQCGAPWVRHVERDSQPQAFAAVKYDPDDPRFQTKRNMGARYQAQLDANPRVTTGWFPSCSCAAGEPVPATVLDPFGGAGTTALVCDRLKRDAILIELNPEYAAMIERRIRGDAGLFAEVA